MCLSTLFKNPGYKKHLKGLFKNIYENSFNIPSGTVKWSGKYLEAKKKKPQQAGETDQVNFSFFSLFKIFLPFKKPVRLRPQLWEKHLKLPGACDG